MATSAFVIYTVPTGELVGTRISRMGNHVPEQLNERFSGDYNAIANFIAEGSKRGGYRTATDAEPYWAEDNEETRVSNLADADMNDYVFHVLPTGEFQSVEVVPSYKLVVL